MAINFFVGFVSHLTSELLYVVNTVISFAHTVLNVNYTVVKWTLTAISEVLATFNHVCCTMTHAFQCGVEDFISFVLDLVGIIVGTLELIETGVLNVFHSVWSVWAFVTGALATLVSCAHMICRGTTWTVNILLESLSKLVEVVVGGLSLLGETFIWTLKLVPMTFVRLGELGKTCTAYVFHLFKTLYRILLVTATAAPGALLSALCAIPKDVYVGIVILCVSVLVTRRFVTWRCLKAMIFRPIITILRLGRALQSNFMQAIGNILMIRRVTGTERSLVNNEVVAEIHEEEEAEVGPSSSRGQQNKSMPTGSVSERSSEEAEMVKQLQEELERIRENHLCVICQDSNKCIILLPCRHFCLCQACVSQILVRDPICPICRSPVQKVLHVYL